MELKVQIPDELASRLTEKGVDLERQALKALVLEGFRTGQITKTELRKALGFAVINEVDGFLKSHQVFEGSYTPADLERDRQTLKKLNL